MAITFKKFATVAAELPATILAGGSKLLFGYTAADKTEKKGLFPYLFDGIKYVMRGLSNAISKHKTAITIAFWSSLILASAVALTLFLWPAALTAVASFSIAGVSIAGLVGAGIFAQVGLIAGLTFLATSIATYIGAAIVNGIKALVNLCSSSKKAEVLAEAQEPVEPTNGSAKSLAALHTETATATAAAEEEEVTLEEAKHHANPMAAATAHHKTADHEEVHHEADAPVAP